MRKTVQTFFWFALLIVNVESGSGLMQSTRWASFGPIGGFIRSITVDPKNSRTLYATAGGVFKSTDGGSNWRRVLGPEVSVSALLIDPRDSNNLFAQTYGSTFFTSTDAGTSWKSVRVQMADGSTIRDGPFRFAVDPQNWATIYAAHSDGCQGEFCSPPNSHGLFKSLDGGVTWKKTTLTPNTVYSIAIDPEQPQVLYAGTAEGAHQSTDGGETWRKITLDFEILRWDYPVAFDPLDSSIVYMGTPGGFYKSVDRGARWSFLSAFGYYNGVLELRLDSTDRRVLYASTMEGDFKSSDGGTTWHFFLPLIKLVARDPNDRAIVYGLQYEAAGTPLLKSTDGGASWRPLYSGLAASDVRIAVEPGNPDTLYAWNQFRLFKSTDGARHWHLILSPPVLDAFSFVVVDPRIAKTVYLGRSSGLFKSTDGGSNWTMIDNGLPPMYSTRYLRVDPQDSNTLYAAITVPVNGFWIGLFKSTDGGLHWNRIGSTLPETRSMMTLNVSPHRPQNVYASFYHPDGPELYRSTDGGHSWTNVAFPASGRITFVDVAFDPRDAGILYAVATCTLFKSVDSGIRWTAINPRISGCTDFAVLQSEGENSLYAGTQAGLFRTSDDGATWAVESGLPPFPVMSFDIIRNSNRKYAAVMHGGVYATFDSLQETQPPSLTLDSTGCIGQPWNLKVQSGQSNAPIRLLGTSNGHAWQLNPWSTTNLPGVYEEKGTFARETEGRHTLHVEVGGDTSNEVNIQVRSCSQ